MFGLLILGFASAQTGKLSVAVAFNTDTNYTLLGPLSTKSLEVDLTGTMYKQMELLVDTASFVLDRVAVPEEISAANNPAMSGIPSKNQLAIWAKNLQKKEHFDLMLIIYKPLQMTGAYSSLEGLSYGVNTSKNYVFSLNNALILNMKTMEVLATTTIESESDFLAGTFAFDKSLPFDNSRNMEKPIEMINKLNQDFALKVFQCLQISKKRLTATVKK